MQIFLHISIFCCTFATNSLSLWKRTITQPPQSGMTTKRSTTVVARAVTDRYLNGIPADSRMAKEHFLKSERRTPELLEYLYDLQAQAQS